MYRNLQGKVQSERSPMRRARAWSQVVGQGCARKSVQLGTQLIVPLFMDAYLFLCLRDNPTPKPTARPTTSMMISHAMTHILFHPPRLAI